MTVTLPRSPGHAGPLRSLIRQNNRLTKLSSSDFDKVEVFYNPPVKRDPIEDSRRTDFGPNRSRDLTTVRDFNKKIEAAPLVRITPPVMVARRFNVLQQFECTIDDVHPDYVDATLVDKTNKLNANEIAEFDLSEFPKEDLRLVDRGAVFYWSIGYETSPAGQIRRISEIRMKRFPKWNTQQLDRLEKRVQQINKIMFQIGIGNVGQVETKE